MFPRHDNLRHRTRVLVELKLNECVLLRRGIELGGMAP